MSDCAGGGEWLAQSASKLGFAVGGERLHLGVMAGGEPLFGRLEMWRAAVFSVSGGGWSKILSVSPLPTSSPIDFPAYASD